MRKKTHNCCAKLSMLGFRTSIYLDCFYEYKFSNDITATNLATREEIDDARRKGVESVFYERP